MGKIRKSIIWNYIFLLLLILITYLFYIFYPKKVKILYTKFKNIDTFTIISLKNDNIIVKILQKGLYNNRDNIIYFWLSNNNTKETELYGFSCESIFQKPISNFYYDKNEKKLYTILSKNRSEYYLYKVWENGERCLESSKIFDYKLFNELQDTTTTVNNIKFYKTRLSEKTEIKKYKMGYRIQISKEDKDFFKTYFKTDIRKNKFISIIAKMISNKTKTKFLNTDVYQIFEFFRRNNYYKEIYFKNFKMQNLGFFPANIVGVLNANDDGFNDILIKIKGGRWINYLLLCYDIYNKKILWKREFSSEIRDIQVEDIDNDGKKEIMFSTYSACYEIPIDWYNNKKAGETDRSYFYIFQMMERIK